MEQLTNYIKPELLVVAVFLYFVGKAIKKSETIQDKWIPLALGLFGVVMCALWVLATAKLSNMQDVLMALFTSFIQGGLVAGLSVYVDQLFKQSKK